MDDISIDIKLGKVSSLCGSLSFTLHVDQSMQGRLHLYSHDPSDLRKSGVLITLDANGLSDLKQIIQKVDQTIEKLQVSNQMKGMVTRKF